MTGERASSTTTETEILKRYLREAHEALLWKLDGLSEYDVRRPMTQTGTNLLGLLKHVASVETDYFGQVLGREQEQLPWMADDAEPNADMYATAEESREWVVDFYRRAAARAEAAIDELGLDAPGHVPWWGGASRDTTVRRLVVHMIAEISRHAGQADIVREAIDGSAGLLPGNSNLPESDQAWWTGYRDRLLEIADGFRLEERAR